MAQPYADRVPPFHKEPARDDNRVAYHSPLTEAQMGMPPAPSVEETMFSAENGAPPPAPYHRSSDAPLFKEERGYPDRVGPPLPPLLGAANAQNDPGMLGYGGDQPDLLDVSPPDAAPTTPIIAEGSRRSLGNLGSDARGDQGPLTLAPDAPFSNKDSLRQQQLPLTDLAPPPKAQTDRAQLRFSGSQPGLFVPIEGRAPTSPLPEEEKTEARRDIDLPKGTDGASKDGGEHQAGTPPPPPPEGGKTSSPDLPASGELDINAPPRNTKPPFLDEVLDVAPQKVPYSEQQEICTEAPADNNQCSTDLPKPPFLDEVLEVAPQKVPYSEQEEICTEAPADNDQSRSLDPPNFDSSSFQKDIDAPSHEEMEGGPPLSGSTTDQSRSFDLPETDSSRFSKDTGSPSLKDTDSPLQVKGDDQQRGIDLSEIDRNAQPKDRDVPVQPKDDQNEDVPVELKDDQKEADQPASIEVDSSTCPKDKDAPMQPPKDDQKEDVSVEPRHDQKEAAPPLDAPYDQKEDAPMEPAPYDQKKDAPMEPAPPFSGSGNDQSRSFDLPETDSSRFLRDDDHPRRLGLSEMDSSVGPKDIDAPVQPKDDQMDDPLVETKDDQKEAAPPVVASTEPTDQNKAAGLPAVAPVEPKGDQKEDAPVEPAPALSGSASDQPMSSDLPERDSSRFLKDIDAPLQGNADQPRSIDLSETDSHMRSKDINELVQPKDAPPADAPVEPRDDQMEAAPPADAPVEPRGDQVEAAPPADVPVELAPPFTGSVNDHSRSFDAPVELAPPLSGSANDQSRSFDLPETYSNRFLKDMDTPRQVKDDQPRSMGISDIDSSTRPEGIDAPVRPNDNQEEDVPVEPKDDQKEAAPPVDAPLKPKDAQQEDAPVEPALPSGSANDQDIDTPLQVKDDDQPRSIDLSAMDRSVPPKDVDAPSQMKDDQKEVAPPVDAEVELKDDQKEDAPMEPAPALNGSASDQSRSYNLPETDSSKFFKDIDTPLQVKGDDQLRNIDLSKLDTSASPKDIDAPVEPKGDQEEDAPVGPMGVQKTCVPPSPSSNDQSRTVDPSEVDSSTPLKDTEARDANPPPSSAYDQSRSIDLLYPGQVKDDQKEGNIDLSDLDTSASPKDIDAPAEPRDDQEEDAPVKPKEDQKEDAPAEPRDDQEEDAPVKPKEDQKEDAPVGPMGVQKTCVPPSPSSTDQSRTIDTVARDANPPPSSAYDQSRSIDLLYPVQVKDDQKEGNIDLSELDTSASPKDIDAPVEPKDEKEEDAPVEPKDDQKEDAPVGPMGVQKTCVPPSPSSIDQSRTTDPSERDSSTPLKDTVARDANPPPSSAYDQSGSIDLLYPGQVKDDQKEGGSPLPSSADDKLTIDSLEVDRSSSLKELDAPLQPKDDQKEGAYPLPSSADAQPRSINPSETNGSTSDDQKEGAYPLPSSVDEKAMTDAPPDAKSIGGNGSSEMQRNIDLPFLDEVREVAPQKVPYSEQEEICTEAPAHEQAVEERTLPEDHSGMDAGGPDLREEPVPESGDKLQDADTANVEGEGYGISNANRPGGDVGDGTNLEAISGVAGMSLPGGQDQLAQERALPEGILGADGKGEPRSEEPAPDSNVEGLSGGYQERTNNKLEDENLEDVAIVNAQGEGYGAFDGGEPRIDLVEKNRDMEAKQDLPIGGISERGSPDAEGEKLDKVEDAGTLGVQGEGYGVVNMDQPKTDVGGTADLQLGKDSIAGIIERDLSNEGTKFEEVPYSGYGLKQDDATSKSKEEGNIGLSTGQVGAEGYNIYTGEPESVKYDVPSIFPVGEDRTGLDLPVEDEGQQRDSAQGGKGQEEDAWEKLSPPDRLREHSSKEDGFEATNHQEDASQRGKDVAVGIGKIEDAGTGDTGLPSENMVKERNRDAGYEGNDVKPVDQFSFGTNVIDEELSTQGVGNNYNAGDEQFVQNVGIPKQDVGLSISPNIDQQRTDIGMSESPYTQYDGSTQGAGNIYNAGDQQFVQNVGIPKQDVGLSISPNIDQQRTDIGMSESPYTQYDGRDDYLNKGYGAEAYEASSSPQEVPLKEPLLPNIAQQDVPGKTRNPGELGGSHTGYDRASDVGVNKTARDDDDLEDDKPSIMEMLVPCFNTRAEDEPPTRTQHEREGEGKPVIVADQQEQHYGGNAKPKGGMPVLAADQQEQQLHTSAAGIGRAPSDYDSMAKYGEDPYSLRPHTFPHPQPEDLAAIDPKQSDKSHEEQRWQHSGDPAHHHQKRSMLQKIKDKLSPSS